MDTAELNNIANRKKITSDVENLRQIVNKENRKIIKLRVAQETAYWDVKEKLRQTQTNHEKLQQNMVELQMQYETVSGKYQDELRFRPETLNKLASTREICDVLEDYSKRLRDTLSRCKSDQATLCGAYQTSGQVVRDLKDKQMHANEHSRLVVDNLQEKIRLTTEHNAQMIHLFNSEKQRMECDLRETKGKLSEAGKLKEELLSAGRELNRELEACRRDCHKKEESINALQKEMSQMFKEFNEQAAEMNNNILKQKEEKKELTSNTEALQQALANQEAFTKSVVSQNNGLQEKLADLEMEVSKKDACIAEMEGTIEYANATHGEQAAQITNINNYNQDLLLQIQQKNEIIKTMELEVQNLTRHMSILDSEKSDAEATISRMVNEIKNLESRVQQITAAGQDLDGKVQEAEKKMVAEREAMEKEMKQLTTTLEEKEKDLRSKTGTISKLMGDVKHGLDVQTELNAQLHKGKQEMETERQKVEELLAKIGQLENDIKVKDAELRSKDREFMKNINDIKELRSDKEHLNQRIVAMQRKIDNVQKTLSGPLSRARPLTPADHDDNAVMFTPNQPRKLRTNSPNPSSPMAPPPRAGQRDPFLIDSSMSLDAVEINRRFEAISGDEQLPPVPLSALKKRRRRDLPTPTDAATTARAQPPRVNFQQPQQRAQDDNVPLSQVRSAAAPKDKERMFFKHRRGADHSKR